MPDHRKIPLHEAAERLREIGRRTPRYILDVDEGRAVLRSEGVGVVATLEGPWTPDLVRLVRVYGTDTICAVAELLWTISAAEASPRVHSAARRLVEALDLDGHHTPSEIREAMDR